MLNLNDLDEEEMDPEKQKKLEQQKMKEMKKMKRIQDEEERKYNIRKDLMEKEVAYYVSVKDQIKQTTDFTVDVLQYYTINTKREHFWGCFKLRDEWKDFHFNQMMEDVEGRILGKDYMDNVYLECFDHIMGSYQEIMLEMLCDFEFRRDVMLKNHWAFIKYAKLKGMEVRDDVRTVSYATTDRYEKKCQMLVRRQRNYRRKRHKKHLETIAESGYDLETRAFNTWVQFRTVFGRFRKDWKVARRLAFILKLKDMKDRKDIEKQKKFICNMNLMRRADDGEKEHSFWIEKNKELSKERYDYTDAFGVLQHTLQHNLKFDESKMTFLSVICLDVQKDLETLKEKVERILRLKELCLKLETQEEKILPAEYIELKKPILHEDFDSAFCVDKLSYRIAIVKTQCIHMDNALRSLKKRNDYYQDKLKCVLSEMRPNRNIDQTMKYY